MKYPVLLQIIFVGIGSENVKYEQFTSSSTGDSSSSTCDMKELERLATAGTRLNFQGRRPERDCVQYVSIERCRKEEGSPSELKALIAEKALANVPWQMTTWMTKNGFKVV